MNVDMTSIINQLIVLFLLMAIGFIAKKTKFTSDAFDKSVSLAVVNITMPALIISAVINAEELPTPEVLLSALLFSAAGQVLLVVLSLIGTEVLRVRTGQKGAYRFMLTFGNVGFLGIPIVAAIFGEQNIIYTAVFNIPFNLLAYTFGEWQIAKDNPEAKMGKISIKTFLSPGVSLTVLALVLAFLGVHNVPVLGDTMKILGSFSTPAALLVIGSQLANMPYKSMVGTPRLWLASLIRLIISPVIIWFVLHFFISDPVILGVIVICAAMPVANMGQMFCLRYDVNLNVMAQGTFICTALCIVTIPLLVLVLTMF